MAKKVTFKILGRIIDETTHNGIAGLRVEAWDKDLVIDDLVGSALTDAEGRFEIEFSESYFSEIFFDRSPDLFFKVFAGDTLIKSTGDSVLWNLTAGNIPVEIAIAAPPPSPDPGGNSEDVDYIVSGTVASPDRAGVGGLRVQIVDKNVGKDVRLAEGKTNPRGDYHVTIKIATVRALGKERPDLQAVVYSGDNLLARSEVRFNASTRETLNVALPANSKSLPSEYETLTSTLGSHYQGRLGELQETETRQDITYLANKIGWDARVVAQAALADQFSARSGQDRNSRIDAGFFYALFRAGLPAEEQTLYHTDAATLTAVWKKAIELGVIPAAHANKIPTVIEGFRERGVRSLLSDEPMASASSLKEMLNVSKLNAKQQQQFAELYLAHRADLPAFWNVATKAFGAETVSRLQLDGKLGVLTLNNAPLMTALRRTASAQDTLTDPVQLAHAGYHRPESWSRLLTADVPIPKEIDGDTPEARRANYAKYLAAQVRLSYPTAAVGEMITNGSLPVSQREQVREFLTQHQDRFRFGAQPVEQYIRQNQIDVAEETLADLKRLQRVYQITQSDEAMAGLLKHQMDSAYKVAQHDKEAFVEAFAKDLGGADRAAAVHDRSVQVHHATLNIAVGYLNARNGLPLGTQHAIDAGDSMGRVLQPAPRGSGADKSSALPPTESLARPAAKSVEALDTNPAQTADDVIAYTTLEQLFGEMDFCACDHCRSILSPAAYLVDLLHFIDKTNSQSNPQDVLFQRRPDIQHLPLTCENTNTALPYIDVVNETLEYFIANTPQTFSLDNYVGHDTAGIASEDLLASPQFVNDVAYATLRSERFPLPLPFHQPLESLRRYFDKFEVPLPLAMERLRKNDALDRTTEPYAWRDILMEELRLSRAEHEILTASNAVDLWEMSGLPNTEPDPIAALSNAKDFTRRVGITYDDLVSLLRTRFINPNADLIPKLELLGVDVAMLAKLKADNNSATDAEFDARLPQGALAPDPAKYGNDIKAWVKDNANHARIMGLITLTDVTGNSDACNFDTLEFRHAQPITSPNDISTRLIEVEFIRLLRFIRLWRKLGWTIEQTDAAICALYRTDMAPLEASDIDAVTKLDAGFLMLLPRLGVLVRTMRALKLSPQRDLLPLLACWSDVCTQGDASLYRQMFLNPTLLKQDAVYADNGYGEFLVDNTVALLDHGESLRAAFNLTGDEFNQIVTALAYNGTTKLRLPKISAIFRHGYLARKLRLSVSELLLLIQVTGLNPFAAPDPANPAMLQLISLLKEMKESGLKTTAVLYLIWNQDLSGKSGPTPAQVNDFARTIRHNLSAIESEFNIVDDPTGEIARARMTLVYGGKTTDFFFSLLNDTFTTEVPYTHVSATFGSALESAILTIVGAFGDVGVSRVSYDDFRQRLKFTGILGLKFTGIIDEAMRDAIKALATDPLVMAEIPPASLAAFQLHFPDAIDDLYNANQAIIAPFFQRYTELLQHYTAFFASTDSLEVKRNSLLANFMPGLVSSRKIQQTLQAVSDAGQTDRAFTEALLNASPIGSGLYSSIDATQPALDDLLALETPGLSAQFFNGGTAGVNPHLSVIASDLNYAPTSNPLPHNSANATGPVSGIWNGLLEAPENSLYSFIIEAETNSTVTLKIDGQSLSMIQSGVVWRTSELVAMKGGTLYPIEITVNQVKHTLKVQWERASSGRTPIPESILYPTELIEAARSTYLRFLKAAALAKALGLSAAETARAEPSAPSWLNDLPVNGNSASPTASLNPLRALLDYTRIKAQLSTSDESLFVAMSDPVAATAQPDSLLYALTGWDEASLDALLQHFGEVGASLSQVQLFRRVHQAFALARTMGISVTALIAGTTNEPMALILRDFQSALRSRYETDSWREVIKPINDQMRGLQRDALVAYILHQMRSHPDTAHIDTADKLFEYFLMDVRMEPCMLTSRIRFALSSVQLFIERCVMNLEPRVSPALLNTKQWEWMKRYRVWEANRKVFLFPENWLEPELRDDKSPFFKEIESELLQSDITEDSAAAALLNYLSKLEEVAKLEPCGIHHVEADPNKQTGDVEHVIARTAGGHRKYYYRRREFGYWTPWEHIKLDIEDNPVVPVVWHDRLLLFWLRIMKQGATNPPPSPPNTNGTVGEIAKGAKAVANTKMIVQAILCWSEYYNGKWQPARTSEIDRPVELGKFPLVGAQAFNRSALSLGFVEEHGGAELRVSIFGSGQGTFLLYNTHSLPMHGFSLTAASVFVEPGKWRNFTGAVGDLSLSYGRGLSFTGSSSILTRKALKPEIPFKLVEPHHELNNIWDAPFFFEDFRHVFFVTTKEEAVLIQDVLDYGFTAGVGTLQDATVTPVVLTDGGTTFAAGQFLSEDAVLQPESVAGNGVMFDGNLIGPSGSIKETQTASSD